MKGFFLFYFENKPNPSKLVSSHWKRPLKRKKKKTKKGKQEVTARLAKASEISMDSAVVADLSELGLIVCS